MATSLPTQPGSPRRVTRGFAFVDLCGFSDYTDTFGDEAAAELLVLVRTVLRQVATCYGVRVDKFLGDGAMLVGVDVADLVRATLDAQVALALSGLPLAMRAGVAVGEVMVFEGDDYIGRCINLAARLCDLASPATTLVPAGLRDTLPANALCGEPRLVRIPGFADEELLMEVTLPLPQESSLGNIVGAALAMGSELVGTTRTVSRLAGTIQREIVPRRRRSS